jgi:hypothetical protein
MCSVSEGEEALKITRAASYETRKNEKEDTIFPQMVVLYVFI